MIRRNCVAWFALSLSACTSAGDGGPLGSARFAESAPLDLTGDSNEAFATPLSNRCAYDVPSAFDRIPAAPTGKIRYRSMGGQILPPFDAKLVDFAGWDDHVQSLARLSLPWDDNRWAAVSRANPGVDGGAGIFLVDVADAEGGDGSAWVLPGDDLAGEPSADRRTYFYYPIFDTGHPGGMQAVGDYLVIALEAFDGFPPLVDIFQRTPDDVTYDHLQRITLYGDLGEPVAPDRFITATAMTRLQDGRYLLFVLGKDDEQQGWFYLSDQTSLSADTTWSFLDYVSMPWLYQNVGLVSECGSGGIYLVATNNIDFDGLPDSGTEYGDLFQVALDADGHVQIPLVTSRPFAAGGGGFCTFRAAANVFVDNSGELLLYCHSYKANTNLLGHADSKLKLVEYAPL